MYDYGVDASRPFCTTLAVVFERAASQVNELDALRFELTTRVDSREPHTWCSAELRRPVARLIAEISTFITFASGDMLLIGVPGHVPRAHAGERVRGEIKGLGSVSCELAQKPRASRTEVARTKR